MHQQPVGCAPPVIRREMAAALVPDGRELCPQWLDHDKDNTVAGRREIYEVIL
jgi:hypothetical protein